MKKTKVLEVLNQHMSSKFAFRNAESGTLYTCECGRRFNDLAVHLVEAFEAAGLVSE